MLASPSLPVLRVAQDRTATRAPTYAIEKISDPARFESLRAEWNQLLSQSSADCLFLTWEWLFTWWKHLARETTPMIVCARRGGPRGALSAIAPMVRQSPSWRQFRPIAGLAFLGTGSIGSDYLDLIARQGEEPESIEAVSRELTAERLMI